MSNGVTECLGYERSIFSAWRFWQNHGTASSLSAAPRERSAGGSSLDSVSSTSAYEGLYTTHVYTCDVFLCMWGLKGDLLNIHWTQLALKTPTAALTHPPRSTIGSMHEAPDVGFFVPRVSVGPAMLSSERKGPCHPRNPDCFECVRTPT